jgi:hypothetical protein
MNSVYESLFEDQRGYELAIKEFGLKPEFNAPVYRKMFPDNPILATSFDAIVGGANKVVAASIVGWNGSAPLTGDDKMSSVPVETLVIARGKVRTEKELMDINLAKTVGNNTILANEFYNDVKFAKQSVDLRKNAMTYELMSDGKITVSVENNEGGIGKGVVLDYGLKAAQRVDAGVSWDTSATAKPIDDIEGILDTGEANGDKYNFMFMTNSTFVKMSKTAQMQASVLSIPLTLGKTGEFATQRLGLDDVNAYLLSKGLPQVVIVESKIRMSDEKGNTSLVTVWKEDIVNFSETIEQGTFNYNTPLEESNPEYTKNAFITNLDKVTIIQSYNSDPIEQKTIGKSIGANAWSNAGSVILLDATP